MALRRLAYSGCLAVLQTAILSFGKCLSSFIQQQNSGTSGFPTPYRTLYHPRIARPKTFRRSEFIELANFGVVEIEPTESGIGHNFEPVQFKNPTWCDRCGDFVWGACSSQQCLQCQSKQFSEFIGPNCRPLLFFFKTSCFSITQVGSVFEETKKFNVRVEEL